MRKINYFIIILFLIEGWELAAQQKIAFISEYIDFTIDDNYFTINGIYNFKNNTDQFINKKISFPFAVETSLIDSIRIVNLNNLQIIPYKKEAKEIMFFLSISPLDTVRINIFYHQKKELKNVYILKSASSWDKPLEEAIYTLTVNDNIKIKSYSIEPDSFTTGLKVVVYYWNKYEFKPDIDFEIQINK